METVRVVAAGTTALFDALQAAQNAGHLDLLNASHAQPTSTANEARNYLDGLPSWMLNADVAIVQSPPGDEFNGFPIPVVFIDDPDQAELAITSALD